MARMEERLKCANFYLFLRGERFMIADGSPSADTCAFSRVSQGKEYR